MIELKFRLMLLGVAWACYSDWVQCSGSNFNPLEECKKQCSGSITPTENPTEVNSQVSILNFLRSCFACNRGGCTVCEIILPTRKFGALFVSQGQLTEAKLRKKVVKSN